MMNKRDRQKERRYTRIIEELNVMTWKITEPGGMAWVCDRGVDPFGNLENQGCWIV